MRVSDYLFRTLADWGVRQAFLVTGGGAMHLDDALSREPRIRFLCNHHEQACAMAAEAYARVAGIPAVVCVTSGPGGTNAITGVMGAWVDSVPLLVLSGQIRTETMLSTYPELKLRQLGDQEINIVDLVRPITKYAVEVKDPREVRYHLERACYLAMTGRPGPVWLDLPLDVQAAEIDPETLEGYDTDEDPLPELKETDVQKVVNELREAERPVVIAGSGIRSAGACERFRETALRWKIPVLTAISGLDLLPSDFPYFFGRPGILGARAANFILQNADLLLVIGTRMNIDGVCVRGICACGAADHGGCGCGGTGQTDLPGGCGNPRGRRGFSGGDGQDNFSGETEVADVLPQNAEEVSDGSSGTPGTAGLCEQLCVSGTAVALSETGECDCHGERDGVYEYMSGASGEGGDASGCECRLCGDGV